MALKLMQTIRELVVLFADKIGTSRDSVMMVMRRRDYWADLAFHKPLRFGSAHGTPFLKPESMCG